MTCLTDGRKMLLASAEKDLFYKYLSACYESGIILSARAIPVRRRPPLEFTRFLLGAVRRPCDWRPIVGKRV